MNPVVLTLKRWYRAYIHALGYGQPVFLLIVRLLVGWGFLLAGSGKLEHPDAHARDFAAWGVPMPAVNVYAAGTAETVCGFLLMLGAASRLITIPLIGTMIVAYATAHKDVFHCMGSSPSGFVQAFVSAAPFPYLVVALVVLLFGPGLFSVDGLLKRLYFDKPCPAEGKVHD
ncbi:MAG TPA: DoxX family protein [Planctomycetales bacterium]|jgi:putative oxidoreductase|nr:DoxX family protein [Planctomycetales bacterium]